MFYERVICWRDLVAAYIKRCVIVLVQLILCVPVSNRRDSLKISLGREHYLFLILLCFKAFFKTSVSIVDFSLGF